MRVRFQDGKGLVFLSRARPTVTIDAGTLGDAERRSLEQLVKLELLRHEPPAQICHIWQRFHADKRDAVATTLVASAYQELLLRADAAPYLILPVYRQEGYVNLLSQFQQSCFLVTFLEAFQANASTAQPCVAISLYDDLLADKGLTLLRADVLHMVDKPESQLVLEQVLQCYTRDELYAHVDTLNNRPSDFDFEAYRLLLKTHSEQHSTRE